MYIQYNVFLADFDRRLRINDRNWNRQMREIRNLSRSIYTTIRRQYQITGSHTWLMDGVTALLDLSHRAEAILQQIRDWSESWNLNIGWIRPFIAEIRPLGTSHQRYIGYYEYANNYFKTRPLQYYMVYHRILKYINALQSGPTEDDWHRLPQLPDDIGDLTDLSEYSNSSQSDEEEANEEESHEEEEPEEEEPDEEDYEEEESDDEESDDEEDLRRRTENLYI